MGLKADKRKARHRRIRVKVKGTKEVPRLSCFRSNRHIFLQLIDDASGHTLFSASDIEFSKKGSLKKRAFLAGEFLAKKAVGKGIKKVVFDRGGYRYHGVVKEVADGARGGGLEF